MRKLAILTLAIVCAWGMSFVFTSNVSAQRPARVVVRAQPTRVVRPAPAPAKPAPPKPAPAPHHQPAPPPRHPHHHGGPNTWGELIGDVIDAAIHESHRP